MEELLNIAILGNLDLEEIEYVLIRNLLRHPFENQRNRAAQFGRLNLNAMTEEEIKLEFRFNLQDLERLSVALRLPQQITTANRHTCTGLEGLCICLRRLAYPNRLYDLEKIFGLSAQSLSDIANEVVNHIYINFQHLLTNLQSHRWLNNDRLQQYSQSIENSNAPLHNCWGFIDGTARPNCRPSIGQEQYFSGHKRTHCVKYQSVLCPDGIIVSLFGAYPGRRHDAGILRDSNLYAQLQECCTFNDGTYFVLYGDPAYGVQQLTAQQQFNARMSTVRQAVEWGFGKTISLFAFLEFKKKKTKNSITKSS